MSKTWCNEIWENIEGFDGRYQVSNLGRVRSINRRIVLKNRLSGHGYVTIAIYKFGKRTQLNVGRLVAKIFIPNPSKLTEINHKNGVKNDNRVENLEWSNRSLNMKHAWRTGLRKRTDAQSTLPKITANGQTMTMAKWSEESGICYHTIWNRIFAYGWPPERAVTEGAQ